MPEKIVGVVKISKTRVFETETEVKSISDYKEKIDEYLMLPVTDLLDTVLAGAIKLDASDIHIEPQEKTVKIRIRVDGLLQDVTGINLDAYKKSLSRIKLLSGIKLNISDKPQDGRFSVSMKEDLVEARVSTLPAEHGESIVVRILNPKTLIEMGALGLREDLLGVLEKEIKKPHGMIIITGPTGSGKTTTLYAILNKIKKPQIKIITIEDPIEYHLEGISQTQTAPSKGYDFASGLRSIMRQDPDVILVGEIRDLETVDIALQASLTGHLVLTTLHTNNAAGAVSRLTALGAKLSSIAPALNVIIAQRLVRRVCEKCSEKRKVFPEELKKLEKELGSLGREYVKEELNPDLEIPVIKSCKFCNSTGYRKRVGIFELLAINDEMERFILKNPSISDLKILASRKGMMTMKQDGFLKVLKGVTTIEEVERVTGE